MRLSDLRPSWRPRSKFLVSPPKAVHACPAIPCRCSAWARLATDDRTRGRGVGTVLLRAVLLLARHMSRDFGCAGVVVDAKPEAVDFYSKYGFFELETVRGRSGTRPEPTAMFLEIGVLQNP